VPRTEAHPDEVAVEDRDLRQLSARPGGHRDEHRLVLQQVLGDRCVAGFRVGGERTCRWTGGVAESEELLECVLCSGVGAVAVPGVGELVIAHRSTHQIEIAGHVGRGHEIEHLAAPLITRIGESLIISEPRLGLRNVFRERNHRRSEDRRRLIEVAEALQGRAAADAPRVEPDQIELRAQLR
jgi:hypothetical protein